jgi:hypothetical protein
MHVEQINGKSVYTVVAHNAVLRAWAAIRSTLPEPPILITLDHHTDTRPAFCHYLCNTSQYRLHEHSVEHLIHLANAESRRINVTDAASVDRAIQCLRNDEHIDAAIRGGLLAHAYVISYDAHFSGTPPQRVQRLGIEERLRLSLSGVDFNDGDYEAPESKIFEVGSGCAVGCEKSPHDDDCHVEHRAQAIESDYLRMKLEQIGRMSRAFGIEDVLQHPFILDIDLDYFGSARSMAPSDTTVFYDLIRRAVAITIATEPTYVSQERLSGETISAEALQPQLREHITRALSAQSVAPASRSGR